ncbi:MAG: ATP-binding protein, partial [Clostridia bacterium]|nr:ATP-binding protein [Clostridia bacterium]
MLAESRNAELKREYVDDIRKTVIAFANTDGGTLYIGVEDDGIVCGLEDVDGTLLRASNAIRDAIRPDVTLFTECRTMELDGKPVVAIDIQRGTARPYYLANKGIRPEGVFVRQGTSTVPATETAILAMIRETGGEHYENARSLVQQLSFEKTGEYFKKHG